MPSGDQPTAEFEHRTFQVDLGLWKPRRTVEVNVGPGTQVGHLIDELTLFLALPRRTEDGEPVEYALRATDGEQQMSLKPRELLTAIDKGVLALALRSGDEFSTIQERIREIEGEAKTEIKKAINEEIEYWLDQTRTLAISAFADARDGIRERIGRRIDDLAHDRKLTVGHQFRTHRGLRRLLRFDAGVGYQDAMRTGLDHAARIGGGAPAVVSRSAAALGWFGLGGIAAAAGTALLTTIALAVVITQLLNVGKDGRDGAPGVAGATWLAGTAPPGDAGVEGVVGDFYFDQAGSVVWSRTGDGWTEVAALRGQDGPSWHVGDGLPADDLGEVRDLYLDRVAGDVWARTSDGWTEPVANLRGSDGLTWHDGDTTPLAQVGVDGDFHLDRCRGVVSSRSEGQWHPVVDLAGTQGATPPVGCTRPVKAGDSLWVIVERECRTTSNRATARAVSETWLASLDVIGGDPNEIDDTQPLLIRCG